MIHAIVDAPDVFNMYHGICLILNYVNQSNIPTVVKKFIADWS